jgi:hypothetical protein
MTLIISHFIQNVHLQHRKLTFSKLKLSYILIYNYTADEQLEKEKKERKKELQWALGNGVEWTANDKEEMAVVESQRCEQLRVTVSGFGF